MSKGNFPFVYIQSKFWRAYLGKAYIVARSNKNRQDCLLGSAAKDHPLDARRKLHADLPIPNSHRMPMNDEVAPKSVIIPSTLSCTYLPATSLSLERTCRRSVLITGSDEPLAHMSSEQHDKTDRKGGKETVTAKA